MMTGVLSVSDRSNYVEPSVKAGKQPLITAENVTKRYRMSGREARPTADAALENVSIRVDRGEFVSIVGPSGCGKTTLLKICAGLIAPTEGTVKWFGEPRPKHRFGMMVFQTAALLPWRTIRDNVALPAEVLGWSKSETVDQVKEVLELVQLPGIEDRYPEQLSGGMQQRVAIARALFADPDVLFMDEPFGALDAMTREDLNLLLQRIQAEQNKTVVFVTHNIQEAVFLGDRVIVMEAAPGRVTAEIDAELPRPRELTDMLRPEFTEIETRVRLALEGRKA